MPLKTSKLQKSPSLWKAASDCSESEILKIAEDLGKHLQLGDRLLLEGPMGAGKTTFTRALLNALGVHQPPEGSPSFAIAHEYDSPRGGVVHIDFYRLRSEAEIEDAGILAYYWERPLIVISEWLTSWPSLEAQVMKSGHIWQVTLSFCEKSETSRNITISGILQSPDASE